MIRTVALGVACLAGLGAIAAAAKKLPLPAEIVFPKVAGSKTDRLPLITRLDTPTDPERVDVAYIPLSRPLQNLQHHRRQRLNRFLVSFLVIGTTRMTGSFTRRASRKPVSPSRKAPLSERPNGSLT